jgi:hypothetical protein
MVSPWGGERRKITEKRRSGEVSRKSGKISGSQNAFAEYETDQLDRS